MTGWDEYGKIRSEYFKEKMKQPNVVDAQRILKPEKFSEISFQAIGLGN